MSHTPGWWTASQYLDNGEWGVLNKDNLIVVGVSSRITKEDAHLIAAAPELLGALVHLVSEGRSHEAIDCGDHCSNKCVWCIATRAIDKAEGRA